MQAAPSANKYQSSAALLLAAKPVLPYESFGSWIQRLCGDHQYSFPKLFQILGFEPTLRDWDLPLPVDVWQRLQSMLQSECLHSVESMHALASLFPHIHPSQLRWHAGIYPSTGWCSECFANDGIPYLRWSWRLCASKLCTDHGKPLSTHCSYCFSPFLLHRSRITSFAFNQCAMNLAHCAECGMPLKTLRRKASRSKEVEDFLKKPAIEEIQKIQCIRSEAAGQRALMQLTSLLLFHRCSLKKSALRQLQIVKKIKPYSIALLKEKNNVEVMPRNSGYERAVARSQQNIFRFRVAQLLDAHTDPACNEKRKYIGAGNSVP